MSRGTASSVGGFIEIDSTGKVFLNVVYRRIHPVGPIHQSFISFIANVPLKIFDVSPFNSLWWLVMATCTLCIRETAEKRLSEQ
jgi:hypothetical protein